MTRKEFRDALAELVVIAGAKKVSKKKLNRAMGVVVRLSRKNVKSADWKAKYLKTALLAY